MNEIILEVKNLQTSFLTEAGPVNAVDGVSFTVAKGRTLGVVGSQAAANP